MSPLSIEVALKVQQELEVRLEEVDRLRRQNVERARYEAEQAQVRFMRVDPNHRLEADSLEADWNQKLRALSQAQEEYQKHRQADQQKLTQAQRERVLSLASNFPKVWQAPTTTDKDRKRMARLVLEDVTLLRGETLTAQVRFKGGTTRCLNLPLPLKARPLTAPEVLEEIDQLLDQGTEAQAALELNQRGRLTARQHRFSADRIQALCRRRGLKTRQQRLEERGLLSARSVAELLGTQAPLVDYWRQQGLLKGVLLNHRNEYLYEHPDGQTVKEIGMRIRRTSTQPVS
jgi:hypothetical protein